MAIFGCNTIGGSNQEIINRLSGSVFTIPENGTANSITAYILNYCEQDIPVPPYYRQTGIYLQYALYKHSDLSLIDYTLSTLVKQTSWGWKTLNLTQNAVLIADTPYILKLWSKGCAYYEFSAVKYASGDPDQGHYQSLDYDIGLPDPLVPTHEDRKYSIYCTYTPPAVPGGILAQII